MRVLIVGYDGGLGDHLCGEFDSIATVVGYTTDIRDWEKMLKFLEWQQAFDVVIYAAGVNLISKFDDISDGDFFESIDVNCYGFVRLIQMMRKQNKLNDNAIACVVTSNAANIAMSHSLSYNCSKAAANMMVRQMGRELRVEELTVFGVAPNKLSGTPMSKAIEKKVCEMRGWTPEEAEAYQLAALPARFETDPADCAMFIRQLIESHNSTLHGTVLPYGGPQQ